MSKLWLLLLLVAAFQTAQSFPTNDDYLEDADTTVSILKDTWGKLKDMYTDKGKQMAKKILAKLKEKLCTQNDFEEDVDYAEEDGEETIASKLLTKIRETMKKVKEAVGEKKEQFKQELEKLRVKFCNSQIEDVEEDEEEFFNDYEEEDGDTTASIMKDTLGKLKELYAEKTKEAAKKLLAILKEKLCTQNDYEEDVDYAEEDGEQMSSSKLVAKIKELIQQIKKAVGEEREKLKKQLEEFRVKLCNYQIEDVEEDEGEFINDYEEDDGDEERGFGKFVSKAAKKGGKKASSIAGKFKKGLKKLKEKAKSCMKKGREFLKKAGMKVDILNCVEKTCNSCLSFMTKKMCMETRFLRTNKTTSVIFTFKILDKQLKEIRVNMGDVPRCVNVGSFVGKICMKLIEGRVKTSVGKVKCNFCMGILSETFGAGVKLCATYEDKKLKFKFSPKMFAGAMTEDGEMVEAGQGDEGEGVVLDADEFELDE